MENVKLLVKKIINFIYDHDYYITVSIIIYFLFFIVIELSKIIELLGGA